MTGAVQATNVVVINSTTITATTPAGKPGTYNLFVTSGGQTSTSKPADLHTYAPR